MIEIDDPNMPSDVLPILRDLGAGLTNHSNWLKVLHKVLICDGDPDIKDLSDNAHHKCLFGQWYYGITEPIFKQITQFREVGELHEQVHNKARALLMIKQDGQHITSDSYEDFIDTANEFRVAVQNMQFSIVSKICAVDHLTGVWNRYAMSYMLSKEHERARRTGNVCSVAIMDFDGFKEVNDKHGHVAGDNVLKTAMAFITGCMRKYDVVFRYGGDEFLFLFPDTDLDHASQLLERLRTDLKDMPININENTEIFISVSIGLSIMDGVSSKEESIELADQALIDAKTRGRDCVSIWQPG
jgi:diguanylate cyclase (GGDEF)-like protein